MKTQISNSCKVVKNEHILKIQNVLSYEPAIASKKNICKIIESLEKKDVASLPLPLRAFLAFPG